MIQINFSRCVKFSYRNKLNANSVWIYFKSQCCGLRRITRSLKVPSTSAYMKKVSFCSRLKAKLVACGTWVLLEHRPGSTL